MKMKKQSGRAVKKEDSAAKMKAAAAKVVLAARMKEEAARKVAEEEEKLRLIKAVEMGALIANSQQVLQSPPQKNLELQPTIVATAAQLLQQQQQQLLLEQQEKQKQHLRQQLEAVNVITTTNNNNSFPIAYVDIVSNQHEQEISEEDNLYGSFGIVATEEEFEITNRRSNENKKGGGVGVSSNNPEWNTKNNNWLIGGCCGVGENESVFDFSFPWGSHASRSQHSRSYSSVSSDDYDSYGSNAGGTASWWWKYDTSVRSQVRTNGRGT